MRRIFKSFFFLILQSQLEALAAPSCDGLLSKNFSDHLISLYRNSKEVMSQNLLNLIIDDKLEKNPKIYLGTYQTSIVRMALAIPDEVQSVRQLPRSLVALLNLADKGITRDLTFNLHAVWGVSEKPLGQEAVFVRRHASSNREVWKIKVDDKTGNPMNYRQVQAE